ncbi:MAG: antibiotic biosynthesis monooxygenase [Thiovulaceae bacterium]|nr:antibiotic biosynthesis monooxygenase [Sulfurimonadaceae bacterium]
MIKVSNKEIIEISTFMPKKGSKKVLLEKLHELLIPIHKEPHCINYELFLKQGGMILAIGRWETSIAYNLHTNMQYIVDFREKIAPDLCDDFNYHEVKAIVPPMTALSLMNEV